MASYLDLPNPSDEMVKEIMSEAKTFIEETKMYDGENQAVATIAITSVAEYIAKTKGYSLRKKG